LFFFFIIIFLWAQPGPYGRAGPQPTCVAGLDSASPAWSLAHASDHLQKESSPAWSLAHASDHLQKEIPLLGLETGSLG